jgi:glycosyltransferase involved in cell wall biosynthesis
MSLKNTPDISVIVPCFNASAWLRRAIDSVLKQNGVSVQTIVIDDGSTDDTVALLQTYGDSIRWETIENSGACTARNRGLQLAIAENVMFLDADDFYSPSYLYNALASIKQYKANIAFGPMVHEEQHGDEHVILPSFYSAEEAFKFLLGIKFLPSSTAIIGRQFLLSQGGWNPILSCRQDVELFCRLLRHDPVVSTWQSGFLTYGNPNQARISQDMCLEKTLCTAHVFLVCRKFLREFGFDEFTSNKLLHPLAKFSLLRTARGSEAAPYMVMRLLSDELDMNLINQTTLAGFGYKILGVRRKERLSLFMRNLFASRNLIKNLRKSF